jgi:hypothetical protein
MTRFPVSGGEIEEMVDFTERHPSGSNHTVHLKEQTMSDKVAAITIEDSQPQSSNIISTFMQSGLSPQLGPAVDVPPETVENVGSSNPAWTLVQRGGIITKSCNSELELRMGEEVAFAIESSTPDIDETAPSNFPGKLDSLFLNIAGTSDSTGSSKVITAAAENGVANAGVEKQSSNVTVTIVPERDQIRVGNRETSDNPTTVSRSDGKSDAHVIPADSSGKIPENKELIEKELQLPGSKAKRSVQKRSRFGDYVLYETMNENPHFNYKVKKARHRKSGAYAVIQLHKRIQGPMHPNAELPGNYHRLYRCYSVLRTQPAGHSNIQMLLELIETERHIGFVFEYTEGGELFDYILEQRFLKDSVASRFFGQLVSAVGYLHSIGIVHRDIKLETVLLDRRRDTVVIGLSVLSLNFDATKRVGGLSSPADEPGFGDDLMKTSCGSPLYAAPEMVISEAPYSGCLADVWSCGVVLVSATSFHSVQLLILVPHSTQC